MTATRLLADCGNSAIKVAACHEGGLWQHQRVLIGNGDAEKVAIGLDAASAGQVAGAAELVVLPVSRAQARHAVAWWRRVGGGRPYRVIRAATSADDGLGGETLPLPELGQYAGCGADRVLAGLVAALQEARDVIVVDAGTATTFAAWRFRAGETGWNRVRFAGGMIAPGAHACALGLHTAAPALPLVAPDGPDSPAARHDTAGAIAAAVGIGHPGMIAACLARLRGDTGIDAVLITGGGAAPLLAAGVVPRLAYRPTLVLEGMAEVVRNSAG